MLFLFPLLGARLGEGFLCYFDMFIINNKCMDKVSYYTDDDGILWLVEVNGIHTRNTMIGKVEVEKPKSEKKKRSKLKDIKIEK